MFVDSHGIDSSDGNDLTPDHTSCNVLVAWWKQGLSAAMDIIVTSSISPAIFKESCLTAGASCRCCSGLQHVPEDQKCVDLE